MISYTYRGKYYSSVRNSVIKLRPDIPLYKGYENLTSLQMYVEILRFETPIVMEKYKIIFKFEKHCEIKLLNW